VLVACGVVGWLVVVEDEDNIMDGVVETKNFSSIFFTSLPVTTLLFTRQGEWMNEEILFGGLALFYNSFCHYFILLFTYSIMLHIHCHAPPCIISYPTTTTSSSHHHHDDDQGARG